jgi:hypothetical protein
MSRVVDGYLCGVLVCAGVLVVYVLSWCLCFELVERLTLGVISYILYYYIL